MPLTERDYDLLSLYIDDALTPAERREVESRLGSDAEFRAEHDALKQTVSLIRALPEMIAPRDLRLTQAMAADAVEALTPPVSHTRTRIFRIASSLTSAAASFILVLAGAVSLMQPATQPETTRMTANAEMPADMQAGNTAPDMFSATEMLLMDTAPPSEETEDALDGALYEVAPAAILAPEAAEADMEDTPDSAARLFAMPQTETAIGQMIPENAGGAGSEPGVLMQDVPERTRQQTPEESPSATSTATSTPTPTPTATATPSPAPTPIPPPPEAEAQSPVTGLLLIAAGLALALFTLRIRRR